MQKGAVRPAGIYWPDKIIDFEGQLKKLGNIQLNISRAVVEIKNEDISKVLFESRIISNSP